MVAPRQSDVWLPVGRVRRRITLRPTAFEATPLEQGGAAAWSSLTRLELFFVQSEGAVDEEVSLAVRYPSALEVRASSSLPSITEHLQPSHTTSPQVECLDSSDSADSSSSVWSRCVVLAS